MPANTGFKSSPVADGKPLTADIVTVEFGDAQHGKLTTGNREIWTTSDAGADLAKALTGFASAILDGPLQFS